jgi:protein-S-isoprenylcysteine O-methyltransferase Ste14
MPRYSAALTVVLLFGMVVIRVFGLRRRDIKALHFGNLDKKDFLIPPFVMFYFYQILAAAFNWPAVKAQVIFQSEIAAWLGVILCLAGIIILGLSLAAFGTSFRIGIDIDHPDKLITGGVFALSRNPLYVAFWIVLLGQFLINPNWITLVYLATASWLFHRQVLREETYLAEHYGNEFAEYCRRVKRYL